MGEWVDRSATPPRIQKGDLSAVANDSWTTSSRDLHDGIDVQEGDDTVPCDLFDELFGPDPSTKTGTQT